MSQQQARWQRVEKLAAWMDTRWNVGGIPIGLDALLGLLPVVGDGSSFLVGVYMTYQGWRMGAP
ncbi:conserved hypothetical protein [gamma proteobacterium HTCC5015]|nr:conserved hypothetical protein [gamma proteobacterium HTCC5015]